MWEDGTRPQRPAVTAGSIDKDLKLNDRVYECSECGHTMNRDKNAAVNILEEAFRILEENMFRPSVEGYKNLP